MSSFSLYTERMLKYWELAQKPIHPTVITHSADVISPICGDDVYVEADIQNGILSEIGVFPRGCAVATACCAIIAEWAKGKTMSDIKNFTFLDLNELIGVLIPENRQYCASMGLRALKSLKLHIPRQLI